MNPCKKISLMALACITLLVIMVVFVDTGNHNPNAVIDYAGNVPSSRGVMAIFRLQNQGLKPVRLNSHCTIYWTDKNGKATNTFFKHNLGYAILHLGESNDVQVPHPLDANVWKISITYQVKPDVLERVTDSVWFLIPDAWRPSKTFIGLISPTITNAMYPSAVRRTHEAVE